jgi:hypothetical protein
MDRFGRMKIIAIKAILSLVLLVPLIPFGLMAGDRSKINTVLAFYFGAMVCSTFSNDLMLFGFEKLPKDQRDNYIVIVASTRIIGIGIVCLIFYFGNKWVYFIIVEFVLLALLIPLYLKYVHESPLQVMVATVDQD